MSKYVPDVISHRWVIIASSRLSRPDGSGKQSKKGCPFCEGSEDKTDKEVFRIGKGKADASGWKVRVIPNRYPITDFHEVIIHSPDHNNHIENCTLAQVKHIFLAYRERFNYYRKMGQVLIFCNNGEHAGASLEHPHSQLVVIPAQINLDTLAREPVNNIVNETEDFISYCPDFSQWPYEVWVAPKQDAGRFGDLNDDEVEHLAGMIQGLLKQMKKIFDAHQITHIPFAYNFYIYPGHNWYLRIIPRFVHRAGFELGTGLNVNVVDPSDAALELKGIESRVVNILSTLKSKSQHK